MKKLTKRGFPIFAVACSLAGSAGAAVMVDPANVVGGTVTGDLVAIDVPFNNSTGGAPVFGGPDWAEDADDGFTAPLEANDGLRGPMGGISRWEPDGTPVSEAIAYFTFGNGPAPSVVWDFSLAASGIDIPDGAVINAVYATWNTRNVDGITYEYTEGAASDSTVRQTGGAAPSDDLQVNWTDADSTVRTGDFELLFTGPITVEGGDGFQLWGTDNVGNAAHIDAVILDISGLGAVVIGDFDGDGDVDGVDIAEMFSNFNGPGGGVPTNPDTDLDGDGDVDGVDIAQLFGVFTGPLAPATVPEPASIAVVVLGGLVMARRRLLM